MARPRKDQNEPCAADRIKKAYWELLEENDAKRITVNMITQRAHCNRGTFYYHYESLDELLYSVIEEELFSKNGLPRELFYLLSNDHHAFDEQQFLKRMKRFGLVMKHAGQECVSGKIQTIVADMWEAILCNEGEKLTLNARVIVEYSISGIIGVFDFLYRENKLDGITFPPELTYLIKENARFFLLRISQAQGISLAELEKRITMFTKMSSK